jgi:ubiquinol-cytochrome c reductase cytochrome b subunit
MMHKRSFYTNNIRAINRIGPHDSDVISVIVGSLLGGAYANRKSGEGVRICFRQSNKHKEYLFWLYNFLYSKGYTSKLQPREYTTQIKRGHKVCLYTGYEFITFTFRSFYWIHELFYKRGTKRISSKITDYITPLALAVWIMNDGCWTKSGMRIATTGFTLSEVTLLNDILKNKYKLDTAVRRLPTGFGALPMSKEKYSIYIKKNSIPKLIRGTKVGGNSPKGLPPKGGQLGTGFVVGGNSPKGPTGEVVPYIHKCMLSKFPELKQLKGSLLPKQRVLVSSPKAGPTTKE